MLKLSWLERRRMKKLIKGNFYEPISFVIDLINQQDPQYQDELFAAVVERSDWKGLSPMESYEHFKKSGKNTHLANSMLIKTGWKEWEPELVHEFAMDKRFTSGVTGVYILNAQAYF